MSRDTFLLCVFSLLAIASVISSYQWLDRNTGLDSRQAIYQAKKMIGHSSFANTPLRLVSVSPASPKQAGWLLSFKKAQGGQIRVLVRENGKTSLI